MPMVTMRYWAAAKQAAGVAQETLSAATLAEALAAAVANRPAAADFQTVLARSSFLVNGEQAGGGNGLAARGSGHRGSAAVRRRLTVLARGATPRNPSRASAQGSGAGAAV